MKLEARGISFQYKTGQRQIFNCFSISVDTGERVGLTAPSGSGKTTLCKILAGYERPMDGCVVLDNIPLEEYRGRLPVQMIWQHPEQSVNPRWKMKQVLREGGIISDTLRKRLGIREEWLERYPSELSGGELQRFCIARALGEGTKLLLADEITTMLDMVAQSAVWHAVMEETEQRGIGILIVSHSGSLLQRICTRQVRMESN